MSLQQAGKWNNIPKELIPELPEAGSTVVFNIKDVQFTDIEGKPRFRQWCTLPSTSSFLNPKTKEIIPIALIRSTNEKGEVDSFKKLDFQPFKTAGTYQITIGASEDDNDTYRFLMLASEREGNELATHNAVTRYALLDVKADAEKEIAARNLKFGAINHAMNMTDADLVEAALVLGISDTTDLKVVRNEVSKYAEQNPKDFMSKVNDEDKALTALIKKALDLGIVYRKEGVLRWKIGDLKIIDLSADEDIVIPREFVRFAKVEQHGDLTVANLKKEIETSQKKTARAAKKAE